MRTNTTLKSSRRGFLGSVIMSWAALSSLPFMYGIMKYVFPPRGTEKVFGTMVAAKVPDIPINSAKIVKFNKRPVILIHTSSGQFKAFRANCTHLGCVVEYKGEDRMMHCNCHGSIFDTNGRNVKGPATLPLEPLKVSLDQTSVVLFEPTS